MPQVSEDTPGLENVSGHIPIPPLLELETGIADDLRIELKPGDKEFKLFAWAYCQQDTWRSDVHRDFWEATLDKWQRHGRPPTVEKRARAIRLVMLRHNLSMRQAADRLGIDFESFRRQRTGGASKVEELLARREPDDLPEIVGQSITSYCLPRIWAPSRDPKPDPLAFQNLSAEMFKQVTSSDDEARTLWNSIDRIRNDE